MRSSALVGLLLLFPLSSLGQSNTCQDLIYDFDRGSYKSVIDFAVQAKDYERDGCMFNIAGLSVFKLPPDQQQENVGLGLWFLSRASDLNYPQGSYNFYKYGYLKSDLDLSSILEGLEYLVASGYTESGRVLAVKATLLGNEIISQCSQNLAESCRGRSVSPVRAKRFRESTEASLAAVVDDVPNVRRAAELKAQKNKEFLDSLVFGLSLGLLGGAIVPKVSSALAPAPASPAIRPFTYDPFPKPMTCWNGNCW